MSGDAVHHAHESVHQGAGQDENATINLARNSMCRLGFLGALICLHSRSCPRVRLHFCHREQSNHPCWGGVAVTQQRNGQFSDEVFPCWDLKRMSSSILTLLQNSSEHCLVQLKVSCTVFREHHSRQRLAKDFLRRSTEHFENRPVAASDVAVQIGGQHRTSLLDSEIGNRSGGRVAQPYCAFGWCKRLRIGL